MDDSVYRRVLKERIEQDQCANIMTNKNSVSLLLYLFYCFQPRI